MGKFYTKAYSWFQTSHEEFWQLQASGKSKKLKFDRLLLSKNTFLQLKHYIPRIYVTFINIYLRFINYLCENSPNYLCHFWNHKSFFSSYFLQKYPIKVLILRLSTAQAKVHQISHVTFQIKSLFFFHSFGLFSVSWETIL